MSVYIPPADLLKTDCTDLQPFLNSPDQWERNLTQTAVAEFANRLFMSQSAFRYQMYDQFQRPLLNLGIDRPVFFTNLTQAMLNCSIEDISEEILHLITRKRLQKPSMNLTELSRATRSEMAAMQERRKVEAVQEAAAKVAVDQQMDALNASMATLQPLPAQEETAQKTTAAIIGGTVLGVAAIALSPVGL